ncbi:MAG: hypothetical protein K0R26_528 [Bacteroidota bacterium]|nr:hypothetical protein [Bacteroidota bacterium]
MHSLLNISVIELDFHHDSLDGFLKIFQNTNHQIKVFTTLKNIKFLSDISYSDNITFVEYSGGSKYLFLKKNRSLLNGSDLIFINTIANDFGAYLAINKRNTVVLRVHNVNKQFFPFQNIFIPHSLYFTWKFISYVARQCLGKGFLWFRAAVNKRINYFTFPDSSITEYVRQNGILAPVKIIEPIPLKIFNESDTAFSQFDNVLNVTIIGAIDARRRQYEQTIEAFSLIYKIENPPVINLTILGKSTGSYGSEIVAKLKKISHPHFNLTTFHSLVPETEFIRVIKNTHLIISPITANATTDIFKEVYGKTKTTGSILDFLKFGKITLVPSHYSPPSELVDFILKYQNPQELKSLIMSLVSDKKINTLGRLSLQYVRENYNQESVLKKTLSIFTSLIKHGQIHK